MLKPRPGIVPFAAAITTLTILGHVLLGFEPSWLHPVVSLLAAYVAEITIEVCIFGWRGARFRASARDFVVFLLPAHITGLAVAMLLYTNEQFVAVAFASAVAVFSKVVFRVASTTSANGSTHFLNPSNFGLTVALLVYGSWIGAAPPYQFTENTGPILDWLLPALIICSGSVLNLRATKRFFVAAGWVAGFVLQAILRSQFGTGSIASLIAPMTGTAFVLFTFYMVTDPATTPVRRGSQLGFGSATALLYGLLTQLGISFGMFFSLTLVCCCRGLFMHWMARRQITASPVEDVLVAKPTARGRSIP